MIPWGDGAKIIMRCVLRGGRLWVRPCPLVRRFAVTKGCKAYDGILSSRLLIEVTWNPNRQCSSASSRVHVSSSHQTIISSTHIDRRWRQMRMCSQRAKMWCMAALSPGGFTAFEGFDYGDNLSFRDCLVLGSARYFFARKLSTMRWFKVVFACARE